MRPRLTIWSVISIIAAGALPLVAAGHGIAQSGAKAGRQDVAGQEPVKNSGPLAVTAQRRPPAGKAKVMPLADDGSGPDIAALRYYLSRGQKVRVEIEIKRLTALYPNWQVPAGIYDTHTAGAVDEQPFWDLFAAGEMGRLRAEIVKRMRDEPGWKPSDDLADKIRRKEMRNKITGMWKAGKWKDLVAFVQKEGYGGDEADVDIMWTVAEAYANTKQIDNALAIYQSILKGNVNPEHRLATVQKAMATLRMRDVEKLIAMARSGADGKSELAPIAIDITRARISAFLHDEREEEVAEADIDAFKDYARKAGDPDQPGLVAWYNYKRKLLPEALEWFKLAISKGGDAMIAHGLSHTLRELKLRRDTEEVSYAWRQPLVNNAILFIDILERDLTKQLPPYIEPPRLLRYAQVTKDSAAGEGAQALAWYAYNTCQFKTALLWFQHAVAWHPKEATVYGLAITLRRLKMEDEFWDLMNRYDGLFPKVIEIIYPDDYYHPPTPCDVFRKKGLKAATAQLRTNQLQQQYQPYGALTAGQGFNQLRPANDYARSQVADPRPAPAWQSQLPGVNHSRRLRKNIREPKISRRLFPVSVDGQNPLRRLPVGRILGQPASAAAQNVSRRGGLSVEPVHPMRQLVARRAPGVGPMPYERWGYQLLPSYKGVREASAPHTAVDAPKGTLWATLHVKDAQATQGVEFDPDTPDGARRLAQALEAIARAPKVPTPDESRNGPWNAPRPYKSQEQLDAEKAPGELVAQKPAEGPKAVGVIRASLTPAAAAKITDAAPSAVAPDVVSSAKYGAPAVVKVRRIETPKPAQAASNPKTALAPRPAAVTGVNTTSPPLIEEISPGGPGAETSGLRIETGARDRLGRQATEAYNKGRYDEALTLLNKRLAQLPETTKLTLLRAWTLLNLRRVEEAKQAFASIGQPRGAAPKGKN